MLARVQAHAGRSYMYVCLLTVPSSQVILNTWRSRAVRFSIVACANVFPDSCIDQPKRLSSRRDLASGHLKRQFGVMVKSSGY